MSCEDLRASIFVLHTYKIHLCLFDKYRTETTGSFDAEPEIESTFSDHLERGRDNSLMQINIENNSTDFPI